MTETLVVRVKRIVSANLSDVVDRMEKSQAEIVMKEAVREVDRAISDIRMEQGKALQRAKQATNQIESYQAKLADLSEKLDFAVTQGRDDLAKAAISRQVDFEVQIKVLTEAASEADAEQTKLTEYVVALDARKRDMESELKVIAQAKADAEAAMPDPWPVPTMLLKRSSVQWKAQTICLAQSQPARKMRRNWQNSTSCPMLK
jgi:phage shock protein A